MDKTEDAPGLVAEDEAHPPTNLMANNVAMKLPAFWPDAAEVCFLDLIRALPAWTPYEVLKDRLITLYSLNDY